MFPYTHSRPCVPKQVGELLERLRNIGQTLALEPHRDILLTPAYRCLDANFSRSGAPKISAHKGAATAKNHATSKAHISDFSSWMSDFDSNVHKLEIPGQYDGICSAPPRVSHHSRVVRYGPERGQGSCLFLSIFRAYAVVVLTLIDR